MTNGTFKFLTEGEKQTKFRAILNTKTCGCLTEEELQTILESISLNRQYCISVCHDSTKFSSLLILTDDQLGYTIVGKALLGITDHPCGLVNVDEAAAIMLSNTAEADGVRALYLYIPPVRFRKGTKNHEQ